MNSTGLRVEVRSSSCFMEFHVFHREDFRHKYEFVVIIPLILNITSRRTDLAPVVSVIEESHESARFCKGNRVSKAKDRVV